MPTNTNELPGFPGLRIEAATLARLVRLGKMTPDEVRGLCTGTKEREQIGVVFEMYMENNGRYNVEPNNRGRSRGRLDRRTGPRKRGGKM